MTIHVPKWVLAVLGVGIVAVAAFLIGRSSGDEPGDDNSGVAPAETEEVAEEPALPCDKAAAAKLVNRGDLAESVTRAGHIPADQQVSDVFVHDLVGCRDLNGDGSEELVLSLACCTAAAPEPWAIFSQNEGRWQAELIRAQGSVQLKVTDQGVRETSAAYGPNEPTCCPSGRRSGLVSWDGERYVYEPSPSLAGTSLEIKEGTAVSLGGLDLQNGALDGAIDAFGTPSSYGPDGEICTTRWTDLGLVINFVNLGGADPCGPEGRVGSIVLTGAEAEQAGWTVSDTGVGVGDSQEDLRAAYPSMTPADFGAKTAQGEQGRSWILADRPSPYGAGERAITLSARLNFGEVVAYDVAVGAGGE